MLFCLDKIYTCCLYANWMLMSANECQCMLSLILLPLPLPFLLMLLIFLPPRGVFIWKRIRVVCVSLVHACRRHVLASVRRRGRGEIRQVGIWIRRGGIWQKYLVLWR